MRRKVMNELSTENHRENKQNEMKCEGNGKIRKKNKILLFSLSVNYVTKQKFNVYSEKCSIHIPSIKKNILKTNLEGGKNK